MSKSRERSINRRSEELRAAVAEFNRVHDSWVADDNRPNPDASYEDAIDAMAQIFDEGDIPADCRLLAESVRKAVDRWDDFCDERAEGNRKYPADEFWSAREALAKSLKGPGDNRPVLKPLETIPELDKQQVPHRIIAKIYGLVDEHGEPQPHLVQRELDKPGSVVNESWVDPRVREWEKQQAEIQQHADHLVEKHDAGEKAAAPGPCPETIHDLWEQKVPARQAAKMLGQAIRDIEAEFKRLDQEREADLAKAGKEVGKETVTASA